MDEIRPLEEIKKNYVIQAYLQCNKNKTLTARKLRVSLRSLAIWLKKWGIKRNEKDYI